MSSAYLFAVIIIAVIVMIVAITKFKVHPFIVLVLVAVGVGIAMGMPVATIMNKVESGFGNILGSIGIIVLAGAIIGVILEKTGAALVMANAILKLVGKKHSVLAIALAGYVTDVPLFCNSGYVVLAPIARAMAEQSGISLAVMATALSAGLFTTHCFIPLHPGTIAMANTIGSNIGILLGLGLIVAIPGTLMGVLYAKKVSCNVDIPANPEYTEEQLIEKYGKLPGVFHSFSSIVLIVVLIVLKSIADIAAAPFGRGAIKYLFDFVGHPDIALILGMFLSMTLIAPSERKNLQQFINKGITNSAGVIAIVGGGGAFGAILQSLPIAKNINGSFINVSLGVFLPFIIAALLKTAMGATTVVQILTATMVLPMLPSLGMTSDISKTLVVLAIAAGSMTVSHANDAYFWIVSEFSDMDTRQAYKCQTGMTLAVGIVSIIFIYILSLFLH
ncbi:GntP family permease [Clostridium fermenticellae]|uniref:GntP family permease n=1 Tax=Clostridium fermenticellae TaxID=2068654 RepID=A0A386H1S9_9CLOT|nr:GntP family permease [Clostridium fermenticellae]AYD39528.1 GntP family permease [Clostridium fermenticellae]